MGNGWRSGESTAAAHQQPPVSRSTPVSASAMSRSFSQQGRGSGAVRVRVNGLAETEQTCGSAETEVHSTMFDEITNELDEQGIDYDEDVSKQEASDLIDEELAKNGQK